ncbi:hypothetical protein [Acrocarpospora corrugata]|uniref:hypothetical protein n=1 Tax=Acrocarpospora corrugata TaxID=35763 RepID=UPI0012D2CFA3|nr:hypothetical protein [Acrocarpospora corrugata]
MASGWTISEDGDEHDRRRNQAERGGRPGGRRVGGVFLAGEFVGGTREPRREQQAERRQRPEQRFGRAEGEEERGGDRHREEEPADGDGHPAPAGVAALPDEDRHLPGQRGQADQLQVLKHPFAGDLVDGRERQAHPVDPGERDDDPPDLAGPEDDLGEQHLHRAPHGEGQRRGESAGEQPGRQPEDQAVGDGQVEQPPQPDHPPVGRFAARGKREDQPQQHGVERQDHGERPELREGRLGQAHVGLTRGRFRDDQPDVAEVTGDGPEHGGGGCERQVEPYDNRPQMVTQHVRTPDWRSNGRS